MVNRKLRRGFLYCITLCGPHAVGPVKSGKMERDGANETKDSARPVAQRGLSLSLLAGLVPAMAAGPAEVADSLYINGNIYTVDEDFSTATTMAVKGDRTCMWATKPGAEAYVGAGTEITDLGGKTVLPGLIEGHMHVSNLGKTT